MKVLIAPDSFKESLDAFRVTDALAKGLHEGTAETPEVYCRPLADGGDGLMQVLLNALGGTTITRTVTGPMGTPVKASLGLLDNGTTAVVEMAAAAGLSLVSPAERNPLVATTRGVGELIRHALDLKVRRIIVGLGGSATNDGGAGMAQALGVSFLDRQGNSLPPGGAALQDLSHVDCAQLDERLQSVEFIGACDVENRLCGDAGATVIYGPQKALPEESILPLDAALHHYGTIVGEEMGADLLSIAGGGAAGGLGAGLVAFTGATLRSGISLVFDAYGDMEECAQEADIIFSGEGAVDGQTLQGKVVAGVAALASRHKKPLLVFAGRVRGSLEALYSAGVTAVLPIAPGPVSAEESMQNAAHYLSTAAKNIGRLFDAMKGRSVHD